MRMHNDKFNLNGSIVDGYIALTAEKYDSASMSTLSIR